MSSRNPGPQHVWMGPRAAACGPVSVAVAAAGMFYFAHFKCKKAVEITFVPSKMNI